MTWQPKDGGELPEAPILMPLAIWQLLYSRGIRSKEAVEKFYSPSLKDLSHPMSIEDMDIAVDRLILAFKNSETIGLYGDYDLDGSPGLALLKLGLGKLGFKNILIRQPLRLKDGYGVHKHLLKSLFDEGAKLVVTIDVGITDVDAITYANEIGLEVIVTDHHLPKEVLPPALAIVNPNRTTCGSGLGHLAGTGVGFYLLLALRMRMQEEGLDVSQFQAKDLLDLFAIATVTDMVPLVNENRTLVKHGLKTLEATEKPGLRVLLSELGLAGRSLNTQDIGFKLAPKLNALSRLEEGPRPLDVFLADKESARRLVTEVMVVNQRRKDFQAQAEKLALKLLSERENDHPFVYLVSEEFHPGVVSVVANRLMDKFQKPTFLGAIREGGKIIGSARSPWPGLNLQDVFANVKMGLEKFGGHAMAAGFETHIDQLEVLTNELSRSFAKIGVDLHSAKNGISRFYDSEVMPQDLNSNFMKWHEGLEPFGRGFESPKYLMRDVFVKSAKSLKNGHMRYEIIDEAARHSFTAPWFGAGASFEVGDRIAFIFEPQWNHWNGRKSLQLLVQDMWALLTSRRGA